MKPGARSIRQKFWFEISEIPRAQWNGTFRLHRPNPQAIWRLGYAGKRIAVLGTTPLSNRKGPNWSKWSSEIFRLDQTGMVYSIWFLTKISEILGEWKAGLNPNEVARVCYIQELQVTLRMLFIISTCSLLYRGLLNGGATLLLLSTTLLVEWRHFILVFRQIAVSLFCWSVEQNAQYRKMTTHVAKGAHYPH